MNSKYLDQFLTCLKEERFYDAHEALEQLWFPRRFEDNDEIKLLKAYINAAVSFELLKRGKKDSAKKVYNSYLKYKGLRLHVSSPDTKSYEKIEKKIEELRSSFND